LPLKYAIGIFNWAAENKKNNGGNKAAG